MTRFRLMLSCVAVCLVAVVATPDHSVTAAEPGWSPVIIATGDYRQQLQSTPIELRPYRPFHFYGNTVRRQHYRGTALPTPAFITPDRSRGSLFAPSR